MKEVMNGDKYFINDRRFWLWLFTKILSAFASVSVWGFVFVFVRASDLCEQGCIDSMAWGMVISLGFGLFLSYKAHGKHLDSK